MYAMPVTRRHVRTTGEQVLGKQIQVLFTMYYLEEKSPEWAADLRTPPRTFRHVLVLSLRPRVVSHLLTSDVCDAHF